MTDKNYKEPLRLFGARLAEFRKEQGITQEQLAELIDKTTDYISLLERGERSPSFEVILDLSDALHIPTSFLMNLDNNDVDSIVVSETLTTPVDPHLIEPVSNAVVSKDKRTEDLERLKLAVESLQEMQKLAQEYGIKDIFQDNGGKTLQLLILLGLRLSPGREGNDAIDVEGKEYELKTINIASRRNPGITTHHHLNPVILQKYRQVEAWYIGIYENITLKTIYKLTPAMLEPIFQDWEEKLKSKDSLNNPKIPMKLVKQGEIVYSSDD